MTRRAPAKVADDKAAARGLAEAAQRTASDPAVSAFVPASAGSGKTKLLTDRLLRLMLAGCRPEKILCLTFTRAAAAEMALRLQRRLGAWVGMADAALDRALAELGVPPGEDVRARARQLFAEVLELPGGMHISTIHAFCQSVLRRFPLEAELSPRFELEAAEDSAQAFGEAERRVLAGEELTTVIERLAPELGSLDRLGEFLGELVARMGRFARLAALPPAERASAFCRAAGARAAPADRAAIGEEAALRTALAAIVERGAPTMAARAEAGLAWLALGPAGQGERFADWLGIFLNAEGKPRKTLGIVGAELMKAEPGIAPVVEGERERLLALLAAETAARCARFSEDLFSLALPVAGILEAEKALSGRLDYSDLIRQTNRLLVDPGAAWVLYKLDGGIEHLLLDEAQDTAPEQWQIADALAAEFFAGAGARERPRTLFAVGDPKQSIFSFQGADPAGFELWRSKFRARVEGSGAQWREPALDVSFRSSVPVLQLVDAVFADPASPAGVRPVERQMHHDPVRVGQAGAVELWPLAPASDPPEVDPWTVPEENLNQSRISAPVRLAGTLAEWIARETGGGVRLDSRGRALRPGDVLVLVRRRNAFSRALVRALKAAAVPVAGLDRLQLAEEPAVADLIALLGVLLLPEDDLTFAEFLTSPLGGLDDGDLLALCPGRSGALFQALAERADERPKWRAAWEFYAALRARADYVSPHALLVQALGPLGGRARLFARLGAEVAEAVDELLNASLRHEEANPPSLQGFLHWLEHSGAEVKREATDAAGGLVRVMTVHGAKGLQAPLVILPDTTGLPPQNEKIWEGADPESGLAVPLIAPRAEYRSEAVELARTNRRRAVLEEHNRLLYVALTRAEDRLVVAGWKTRKGCPPEDCWYSLVAGGFARLRAERSAFSHGWPGERLIFAAAQETEPEWDRGRDDARPASHPGWAGGPPDWRARPPEPEPQRPERLAPSRPEGVALGAPPPSASPLVLRDAGGRRFRRGLLVHSALQHLPGIPPEQRQAATLRFFARAAAALPPEEVGTLASAVLAVLGHPDLAELFGPKGRSEVPLTGLVGGNVVGGLVDRLLVLPDRVLIADFKTNRRPPETIAQTPPLYLRQLALYRAVLNEIFPDRPVTAALVWTETGRVDVLPGGLLDQHNPASSLALGSPA